MLAALCLVGFALHPARAASEAGGDLLYIGSHGTSLLAARFDPADGALRLLGPVAQIPRPTWAVAHPRLPVLYVGNEEGNDGRATGSIIAYRITPQTGALTRINEVRSGGGGTTYIAYDDASHTLFAANYGGGSVSSLSVRADGGLGQLISTRAEAGSGPHRRQAAPHPHAVMLAPDGHHLLVSDLGADRMFVHRFDPASHALLPDGPMPLVGGAAAPGSGPRHLAFHPDGRTVYATDEMAGTVETYAWDAALGALTSRQRLALDPADFTGDRSAGEVLISRDGRFVYATDRGDQTVAVLKVLPDHRLALVQKLPSGGDAPWSLALHRSGRWLLAANEKSGVVAVFAIDRVTGLLAPKGAPMAATSPVSLTFAY